MTSEDIMILMGTALVLWMVYEIGEPSKPKTPPTLPKIGMKMQVVSAKDRKGSDAFKGYVGIVEDVTDGGLIIRGESSSLVIPKIGYDRFIWRQL